LRLFSEKPARRGRKERKKTRSEGFPRPKYPSSLPFAKRRPGGKEDGEKNADLTEKRALRRKGERR